MGISCRHINLLVANLIEEVYEVIEAIDLEDEKLLCEELGDLLMQIVFQCSHGRRS